MDAVLLDIMDEPKVVADTVSEGKQRLPALASRLKEVRFRSVYAVGSGSSNFVGLAGRYAIEEWAGIPTLPLSGVDFQAYSLNAADALAVALVISQSGESFETVSAAQAARDRGLRTIALTNNENSRLARVCDDVILTRAGSEEGPGTKTVLAQCVAIYQFALHLAAAVNSDRAAGMGLAGALCELESAPGLVLEMLSRDGLAAAERVADELVAADGLYLVAAGPFTALMLQAANVIREVGKLHCYPFEATEFRHGPLEVLSARSTVLVTSNARCRVLDQVARACHLAREAGARLIYVGDEGGRPDVDFAEQVLLPGSSELLAAQVGLPSFQLIGYFIAKKKGCDPNRFVNIVKTWAE